MDESIFMRMLNKTPGMSVYVPILGHGAQLTLSYLFSQPNEPTIWFISLLSHPASVHVLLTTADKSSKLKRIIFHSNQESGAYL